MAGHSMTINLMNMPYVLHFAFKPRINVAIATLGSISHLWLFGCFLFIDNTFNMAKPDFGGLDIGSIKLFTIMMHFLSFVYIPVYFFFTMNISRENVALFLRLVGQEPKQELLHLSNHDLLCHGQLAPKAVLGDFARSLRVAVQTAWPGTFYWGDFLDIDPVERKEGLHLLRNLAIVPTWTEFEQTKADFLHYWETRNMVYCHYFKHQWMAESSCPPCLWALYFRNNRYPSGDQPIEGFHNELKQSIPENQALDQLAIDLHNKLDYWDMVESTLGKIKEIPKEQEQRKEKRQQQNLREQENTAQVHIEELPTFGLGECK